MTSQNMDFVNKSLGACVVFARAFILSRFIIDNDFMICKILLKVKMAFKQKGENRKKKKSFQPDEFQNT